ncbi:NAD-dependent malic enzyme [Methanosarcina siciliae T4/M]|uniref:NAD-dependent malic enzyme n=3 Tax=Methanosarcina siciliae TaxID=38027 RepID=A0A0E3LAW0_9EURY|nr:NADP-dependent malic enzyme [Methanosarcina siciliae]AKB28774.1 NAD-dependent malic enzyme [Methanosarcina siciliae T4/M]AKB32706.1 NAD-dependent malic enzyme [Methanosarcina siciliae HI350]
MFAIIQQGAFGIKEIHPVSGLERKLEENIEENSVGESQKDSGKDIVKDSDTHASLYQESLAMHRRLGGVLEVESKVRLRTIHDLSVAYTPGVAEPCRKIKENPSLVYLYTIKKNTVAVITDGSAVLGLGNIGPCAALPVMEGKAIIFKEFAGIDAFPICLDTQDTEEVIKTVQYLAPAFGGINLEDISAPRCFEIESRLREELDIPVIHDDQHGAAIVVFAGLLNALKIVKKKLGELKILIAGLGAAGVAIFRFLIRAGADPAKILTCDSQGIVYEGREIGMNPIKEEIARLTNPGKLKGRLKEAFPGTDLFIGVSAGGTVTEDMVRSMAKDAIVMAMANPTPEIMPDAAKRAGARIVATGRSDFPNQLNNCLSFPGVFKGALGTCARKITPEMEMAAAYALANVVSVGELSEDYIIPEPLDKHVVPAVAKAVANASLESCAARRSLEDDI